jgi:LAS superfamily LD-carboxypeptidase LdcB
MAVSMRRIALVLGFLAMATTAQARTATGYSKGEKTKIKIVSCGNSEAEVHTAIAFRAMARAASKAGHDLRIRSGFRSYEKQKRLYKKYRRGQGNLAARPGYSNHESGRALDIYITDYRVLEWLNKHAAEYGFHRTVPGEAWHWEYLGGYEPKVKRDARRAKHLG